MKTRFSLLAVILAAGALVLSTASSPSKADIAPNPLTGGVSLSQTGGATNQVRMVEETVKLRVSPKVCRTDVVFHMKNVTDAPVTMNVGFPQFHDTDLQGFSAKVAGKPVAKLTDVPRRGRNRGWKLWETTFPPGEAIRIDVSYHHEMQGIYSWTVGRVYTDIARKLVDRAEEAERRKLAQRLAIRDVKYILRTGRGWAGKIGRCRIEVSFEGGLTSDNLALGHPRSGYKDVDIEVTKKGMIWEFRDFEPQADVYFQVSPFISRKEMHELLKRFAKRLPDDPYVVRIHAEYLKAAGETEKATELVEDLILAWTETAVFWGQKTKENRRLLENSGELWSLCRRVSTGNEPDVKHPKKVAPAIEKIAARLLEQMQKENVSPREAKLFGPQFERAIAWSRSQKEASKTER